MVEGSDEGIKICIIPHVSITQMFIQLRYNHI